MFIFFLLNLHSVPHNDSKIQNCRSFCKLIKRLIYPEFPKLEPAHTAKSTNTWFNDHEVTVLDWPANSSDLNLLCCFPFIVCYLLNMVFIYLTYDVCSKNVIYNKDKKYINTILIKKCLWNVILSIFILICPKITQPSSNLRNY